LLVLVDTVRCESLDVDDEPDDDVLVLGAVDVPVLGAVDVLVLGAVDVLVLGEADVPVVPLA
jgi:hypothetical protein